MACDLGNHLIWSLLLSVLGGERREEMKHNRGVGEMRFFDARNRRVKTFAIDFSEAWRGLSPWG